ncbi:hypothetical protein MKW94_000611 [Papaver nudicaule]|uniref:Uncharacterized protein n=1 Tax=Papaver nudicaule TaxID=74823 RepID=A0AA41VC82_PAPNU|nr:hypothetical protein [Papaver nudicaule]
MELPMRPNRSDVHLSAEEETKIENETRKYFDDIAPKRVTKPQRSDYSSQSNDPNYNNTNVTTPELTKFQELENHQDLVYNETTPQERVAEEEYTETEYYKDLNCIDKQHHTTGTGFIKVNNNGDGFHLSPDTTNEHHSSSKGNPATNDWIPASNAADTVSSDSHKLVIKYYD